MSVKYTKGAKVFIGGLAIATVAWLITLSLVVFC